jgi:hypothetical protein
MMPFVNDYLLKLPVVRDIVDVKDKSLILCLIVLFDELRWPIQHEDGLEERVSSFSYLWSVDTQTLEA